MNSVGNYRNHKTSVLTDAPWYLQSYIEQYFNKADLHFERLMDICINIPEQINIVLVDSTNIILSHAEIDYSLQLTPELTNTQILESEFVLALFKRIRLIN